MISFNVTRDEHELIQSIAERAHATAKAAGVEYSVRDALMDVTATHANGCRLQLAELATANKFDFAHDVFGIRRHLDRRTGHLQDCFLPRYAERTSAALEDATEARVR